MPSPEWIDDQGVPYEFVPGTARNLRGNRLPGASLLKAGTENAEVTMQQWEMNLYSIGCRVVDCFKTFGFEVKEKHGGLRLEAVLTGELNTVSASGLTTILIPGQYQVTDILQYTSLFKENQACSYFVSCYPAELIKEFGYADRIFPSGPRQMPASMHNLIYKALHNPYRDKLRDFYYQNLVRDLLFIHLSDTKTSLPGELSDSDIAAVYQADAILSTDLSEHYTIQQLSRMANTNAFKLKKGFRLIFKMGVFGRLLYRRMEQAKLLLETTSKPIKEVAFESGYESVAGFITGFRKRFGATPLEWRENKGRKTEN